jgi:hypothetical protein
MQPELSWVEQLNKAGFNRFGGPNFRIIWGPERMEWIGGLWVDRDENTGLVIRRIAEERCVPRYSVAKPRWIVEKWLPPEYYGSPESWYQETQAHDSDTGEILIGIHEMGPYPQQGEYEQCFTFEDDKGRAYQPTTRMLEILVWAITNSQGFSMKMRMSAIQDRLKRNEEAKKKLAHDIAEDALPAFRGNMFTGDSKRHAATATSKVPLIIVPGMGPGLIQLPINQKEN